MRDAPSQRRFDERQVLHGLLEPFPEVLSEFDPSFLEEDRDFPDTDRRQEALVIRIRQLPRYFGSQLFRRGVIPDPNVCVEQKPHLDFFSGAHSDSGSGSWAASQSDMSPMGPTISPKISMVPIPPPSRIARLTPPGGLISAMGWPKRVTRIGCPVFRTRSRTARQVALNFEMAISSMYPNSHEKLTSNLDRSQTIVRPWSCFITL